MKYTVRHDDAVRREIERVDVDELLRAVICPDVPPDSDLPRNTGAALIYPTTAEKARATACGINDGRRQKAVY